MKQASAILTDQGGRTCHAEFIASELGIPAIVGCDDVAKKLSIGQVVKASCPEGESGNVSVR